jgi:4,5-DOPA dioxygenase extradiol
MHCVSERVDCEVAEVTGRLPTLFLSHGAPTLALDSAVDGGSHGTLAVALAGFANSIPRPKAVLVVSAHWGTGMTMLTGATLPETLHDFSGFDPALLAIAYPARGSSELATQVHHLLGAAGIEAGIDLQRGFDHGAWVPLLHLYPGADVPVVQMSLQPAAVAGSQHAIGRALSSLPGEGVLVIGSGGITHDLRTAFSMAGSAVQAPWARAFADWADECLASGDTEALLDWRVRGPEAERNHPTAEHLLPLFLALGAAGESWIARRLYKGAIMGTIALDSWAFDS